MSLGRELVLSYICRFYLQVEEEFTFSVLVNISLDLGLRKGMEGEHIDL